MSLKHRSHQGSDYKLHTNNYQEGKHTYNEYKKFLLKATHPEILKEYNKLLLLMNMMKHKGVNSIKPYPDKTLKADNIRIIKYKYNMICQEINKRNYHILNKNYKMNNSRYKSL